ncbi:hypothetical protein BJ508DRAFT_311085 [Ascobolus immersus RN42]|uniref:Uncharacterized protein n=1 Tax=Ascobolus immersus RN42 TaxID=1160509 RepID=A0A3N4I3M7_ASCIM|nr:hypothetical protein BJ508DRAFT_311085 [Ascobolus immersus RN42]
MPPLDILKNGAPALKNMSALELLSHLQSDLTTSPHLDDIHKSIARLQRRKLEQHIPVKTTPLQSTLLTTLTRLHGAVVKDTIAQVHRVEKLLSRNWYPNQTIKTVRNVRLRDGTSLVLGFVDGEEFVWECHGVSSGERVVEWGWKWDGGVEGGEERHWVRLRKGVFSKDGVELVESYIWDVFC